MSIRFDCAREVERERGITRAAQAVGTGELVVLPTDTVYGVGCDAFSPAAVEDLLAAKGRGRAMPPPVLVASVTVLDALAVDLPPVARSLAERFWPGALTLVCRARPGLDWDLGDTGGTVAVRMPLHPVALELLDRAGPMAVSSANLSGRPAATTCAQAEEQLAGTVAVYLDGGPSAGALASTIVDVTGEVPSVLRLGALSLEEIRTVAPELRGPGDGGASAAAPGAPEAGAPEAAAPDAPETGAPETGAPEAAAPDAPEASA